jgi:ubiquinone/menaquinone biosynthesis C-methylase UbiE
LSINPGRVANESRFIVPSYLRRHYWWAYVHPNAVRVFERQWLVNLILWGNFSRLRDAAIDLFGTPIRGRSLQVACVYGDLTRRLLNRHAPEATLDVVDVLPVQLENLANKIGPSPRIALCQGDSAELDAPDGWYDQVLVFFLLHEMPRETRRRTVAEALRVTKPGGRLVFVDYHRPHSFNPVGWLMRPILKLLEPFAMDLWREEIVSLLSPGARAVQVRKRTWFGGLYQLVELRRA